MSSSYWFEPDDDDSLYECPRTSPWYVDSFRHLYAGYSRRDTAWIPMFCGLVKRSIPKRAHTFRFIDVIRDDWGSEKYIHKDFSVDRSTPRSANGLNLPQVSNINYHGYPFAVVKRHNGKGKAVLQVFIYSQALLGALMEALELGGIPGQHRLQDGVKLLQAWEKLRQYLSTTMNCDTPFCSQRTLELKLLVHVFMESGNILSGIGINELYASGLITPAHYRAIHWNTPLYQDFEDLRYAFTPYSIERSMRANCSAGNNEASQDRRRCNRLLYESFESERENLAIHIQSFKTNQQWKPIIKYFHKSQDFWNIGIDTFQKLAGGGSPTTILQALSSICVSIAMAKVLDQEGVTFGMRDEVVADIERWRIAILDPSEKETFDETTKVIWPRPNAYQAPCTCASTPHWDSFEGLARLLVSRSKGLYCTKRRGEILRDTYTYERPDMTSPEEVYRMRTPTTDCTPIIQDPVLYPPDPPGPAAVNYTYQPVIPISTSPISVSGPLISAPDLATKVGILIMAGAIFIVIIIFLNFMRFQCLIELQQSHHVQKGLRWREIAQERLKSSLDMVQNGLFDVLRRDKDLSCFDEIFETAMSMVKSKALTGFSDCVSLIQLEAQFQFPEKPELLSYLRKLTCKLQYSCIYQVISANIRLQCAELELYIQEGSEDPDDSMPEEIFSDKNGSRASPKVHSNYQRTPRADPKTSLAYTARSTPNKRKTPPSDEKPFQSSQEPKRQAKDQKFTCEACDKGFSNVGNLNRHIKESHNKQEAPDFQCEEPTCGETFTRIFARDKHHRNFHPHLFLEKEGDAGLPPRHVLVANGYTRR